MYFRSTSLRYILIVCSLAVLASETSAEEIETTSDRVIFGRESALWSIEAKGGEPTKLVDLPWPAAKVKRMRAAANGSALLINAKGFVAWTALDEPASLRFLPCSGPSEISSDGNQVVCGSQDARHIVIYSLRPNVTVRTILKTAPSALFFGSTPQSIVGALADTLIDFTSEERLASHRPDRSLVVTPDGKRALGAYKEDGIDIVYGFRLDGKAVKRTLMHAARGVATSADSGWAAIQQDIDACAVRIVGGQYMCWRRVEAMDISSAGHSLLVTHTNDTGSYDLLLGAVRGTSSVKPTPLVQEVAHEAIFWPAALQEQR